jgi:hypothetical protein
MLRGRNKNDTNTKLDATEINNKKRLIEGYCEGKSQNFCSVEHLKMMNKTIEERERGDRKRMRIIKDNILKEIIIMNIRHTREDHE